MHIRLLGFVGVMVATTAVTVAQTTENAQFKALKDQLAREAEAQKAVVQRDIDRNPNGKNAQEARAAAERAKAAEVAQKAAEAKAKVDMTAKEKAAAEKKEKDEKEAAEVWAAGAAKRDAASAEKQAAVDKWRASAKPAASIIMGKRADGTITVMVDGKISTFKTVAEADAFVEETRRRSDTPLSY